MHLLCPCRAPDRIHRRKRIILDNVLRSNTDFFPVAADSATEKIFKEPELLTDIIRRVPIHAHGDIPEPLIAQYNVSGRFIQKNVHSGEAGRGPKRNIDICVCSLESIVVFKLRYR